MSDKFNIIIESRLRRLHKDNLIDDFKQSIELQNTSEPQKRIIERILNDQALFEYPYYIASKVDSAICKAITEDGYLNPYQ